MRIAVQHVHGHIERLQLHQRLLPVTKPVGHEAIAHDCLHDWCPPLTWLLCVVLVKLFDATCVQWRDVLIGFSKRDVFQPPFTDAELAGLILRREQLESLTTECLGAPVTLVVAVLDRSNVLLTFLAKVVNLLHSKIKLLTSIHTY